MYVLGYVVRCALACLSLHLTVIARASGSTSDINPLCSFIAATNVESIYSSWSCTATGQTIDNPCDTPVWDGITCSNGINGEEVSSLSIEFAYLSGTLPAGFGNMTSLETLSLSDNLMSGPLQTTLGKLVKLRQLSLNSNYFEGNIPTCWGSLTKLTEFILKENLIAGTIPNTLGSLVQLQSFEVEHNMLIGILPTIFGQLTALSVLHVGDNQLHGRVPSSLHALALLESLNLVNNFIDGPLPTWIGNMTILKILKLSGNQFSGPLPTSICQCGLLTSLELNNNLLTGSITECIGYDLKRLGILVVDSNFLTGQIPANLAELPELTAIYLDFNIFTGRLPATLGQMSTLYDIYVQGNMLTGPIQLDLGGLYLMEELVLYRNSFTGTVPVALALLPRLQTLLLYENSLTGTLSSALCGAPSLQQFTVASNTITGQIPACLGSLTGLDLLSLSNNVLSGTIPTTLGSLTALTYLYLNNNAFTGSIPTAVAALTRLLLLSLGTNFITGSIPSQLSACSQLQDLILELNILTGSLPSDIESLALLRGLALNNNHFTGTVPASIGVVHMLQVLELSDNFLSGPVPSSMVTMDHLFALSLATNLFTGTLPSGLGVVGILEYFEVQKNSFHGPLAATLEQLPHLVYVDAGSNSFNGSFPANVSASIGYINVAGNMGFTGSLPSYLGELKALHDVSSTGVVGSIPSSLCSTTSLSLDVSATEIQCFSGCLTSSQIIVYGASASCHDGSIMRRFIIMGAMGMLLVAGFTISYRQSKRCADSVRGFTAVPIACNSIPGILRCCWQEKVALSSNPDTNSTPAATDTEKVSVTGQQRHMVVRALRKINPAVAISVIKTVVVVIISLSLSDWWTYSGGPSVPRNNEVVASCSNPEVGNCFSFCGAPLIVNVTVQDDDLAFDDIYVPPQLSITKTNTYNDYCVAELPGYCAYKYWLVFKLVPLLLHLFQLVLQTLTWWHYRDFTPQQQQYDVIIRCMYPFIADTPAGPDQVPTAGAGAGAGAAVGDSDSESATAAAASFPAFSKRIKLIRELANPPFYCIFACVETLTVLYVWGELMYPYVYCGAVRPLSLYYYPILMSLAELMKFNIYVSLQHSLAGRYSEALCAVLNAEMFLTNLWVSTVLAVLFLVGMFTAAIRATKSVCVTVCWWATGGNISTGGGVFAWPKASNGIGAGGTDTRTHEGPNNVTMNPLGSDALEMTSVAQNHGDMDVENGVDRT